MAKKSKGVLGYVERHPWWTFLVWAPAITFGAVAVVRAVRGDPEGGPCPPCPPCPSMPPAPID